MVVAMVVVMVVVVVDEVDELDEVARCYFYSSPLPSSFTHLFITSSITISLSLSLTNRQLDTLAERRVRECSSDSDDDGGRGIQTSAPFLLHCKHWLPVPDSAASVASVPSLLCDGRHRVDSPSKHTNSQPSFPLQDSNPAALSVFLSQVDFLQEAD